MQKSKIEWCDSTWNPVTGCRHGCKYCYARRIAERFGGMKFPTKELHVLSQEKERTAKNGKKVIATYPFGFEPTLYRYRLGEPLYITKPRTIFVCSMADLFGEWVPTRWIVEVLDACLAAPQHRYMFLTKNPERYEQLDRLALLPRQENFWYGQTMTTGDEIAFAARERNSFLSVEPLMAQFSLKAIRALTGYGWVIIGAMTGPGAKKYLPARGWVEEIVTACQQEGIPIFMKDSLIPIMGEDRMRRELPWDHQKEV